MQAVILAGGLGTRLRPITEQIPKVLVPVNGKPFLLYLLELLKIQEVNNIVLCIGYLGKKVSDYFGNGDSFGLRIKYSEEKKGLLGTGGALKQAQNLLSDYFFVINGDTYLPTDYGELERVFLRRGKKALMIVYDNKEATGIKSNVKLDDHLMILRHDKESLDPDLKYTDAGVLVIRREALDFMKEGCPASLEQGLYPILIQQKEMAACVVDQRFYDIGTPEQRRMFEEFLKGGPE